MTNPVFKPLSEVIFGGLDKTFRTGGLVLSLLSLGVFLMLLAFFSPRSGASGYIILGVGLSLVMLPAIFFYFKEIKPIVSDQRSFRQNKELADSVQRAALEMTKLASDLQSLAFKHADELSTLIETIKPQLREIPILDCLFESQMESYTVIISSAIIEYREKIEQIINDVETALITSNPQTLKRYLSELRSLRNEVEDLLRQERSLLRERDRTQN